MSKPLLSRSRFESLLWLVRPPKCEWWNIWAAMERFELSDEQREQLAAAVWLMFRHRTNTLTAEDKALLGRKTMNELTEFSDKTTYKWYSDGII